MGDGGVHTFNPSLRRKRQANLCEFAASLIYKVSSRTARSTQRNPVMTSSPATPKKKEEADLGQQIQRR